MEEWRPVSGYEGLYEVSNAGNVRSLVREAPMPYGGIRVVEEKLLAKRVNKGGYHQCHLAKNGTARWITVHRLVAEAFIPNPLNKETINHKNGIKTDNRASELEWATQRENEDHATASGLKASGARNGWAVLDPESVQRLIAQRRAGVKVKTLMQEFGVSKGLIYNVLNGEHWTLR